MPLLEEYRLTDKVAVLAGEGNEFTPYLAEVLAEAGASVYVMAARRELMKEVVERVGKLGGQAFGSVCDASIEGDVEAALDDVISRWGRLDVLVNDFRTEFARPFDQVTPGEFEAVMRRNVTTVYVTCRAVGRRMVLGGRGRIINIISGLAERALLSLSRENVRVKCSPKMSVVLTAAWFHRK